MNVGDRVTVSGARGTVHAINSDGSIVVEFAGSPELTHFAPSQVQPFVEPLRQEPQSAQEPPKSKRVR